MWRTNCCEKISASLPANFISDSASMGSLQLCSWLGCQFMWEGKQPFCSREIFFKSSMMRRGFVCLFVFAFLHEMSFAVEVAGPKAELCLHQLQLPWDVCASVWRFWQVHFACMEMCRHTHRHCLCVWINVHKIQLSSGLHFWRKYASDNALFQFYGLQR